jgi:aerobic carbon-monoxide dehydrogenase large subunit
MVSDGKVGPPVLGGAKIGDAPKRREDAAFLTGRGAYLDDLVFDAMCHAVFVRSPHAHARIEGIETGSAKAAPGVLAILTAQDAGLDGLKPLMPTAEVNPLSGEAFAFLPQPLLAEGVVRHAGEAVALIVAETMEQALDAMDLVEVSYEPLPAVTNSIEAAAADAPRIVPPVPNNLCLDWRTGDPDRVEAAFESAEHVVELSLDNHRIVTNPMEPRGIVGTWDADMGRYVLHVSTQNLHAIRDVTAGALGVDAGAVRLIAPDVGGGFGTKNFAYVEYPLIAWAARRIGRPVKWIATRSEVFLTDHQARDHISNSRLALDAKGRFLALRVESVANLGAYMIGSMGVVETVLYAHLPGTVYRIPAIALHIQAVLTNTAPNGVTRAPGYAEANMVIERLIDAAAGQCGFDRAALRRLNMVLPDTMPFTNALGETVDSGTFAATLDMALGRADVDGFNERRRQSEAQGRLRGLGFAYHIKGTGGSPHENVEIRFEPDDTVSFITGTQTIGQGHHTTFPQIIADLLGLDNDQIHLREGDTDLIANGGGHGSSRSTYMAGTAIVRAVEEIVAKGAVLASEMLETAAGDIHFEDGRFLVAGTDRSVGLLEVAERARKAGAPLDTYHAWTREWMTFPNGAHVVEVEIDRDTGAVEIARYTGVDDYGVVINPMIAAGQAHGAITQGIGQALLERTAHDSGNGQPLAASLLDYALPRADDVLSYDLAFNPTPCTTNPLGVKGCGEAGVVAAPPAIANAIVDALAPLGVTHFDGPATPERVWWAMLVGRDGSTA